MPGGRSALRRCMAHPVSGNHDGHRLNGDGLAFALVATRTRFPFKKGLRLLTVLPIITPPFVIGLALTLLFAAQAL